MKSKTAKYKTICLPICAVALVAFFAGCVTTRVDSSSNLGNNDLLYIPDYEIYYDSTRFARANATCGYTYDHVLDVFGNSVGSSDSTLVLNKQRRSQVIFRDVDCLMRAGSVVSRSYSVDILTFDVAIDREGVIVALQASSDHPAHRTIAPCFANYRYAADSLADCLVRRKLSLKVDQNFHIR